MSTPILLGEVGSTDEDAYKIRLLYISKFLTSGACFWMNARRS